MGAGFVAEAIRRREARRSLLDFAVGGVTAVAFALLLTYRDSWTYFAEVLPAWSGSPLT